MVHTAHPKARYKCPKCGAGHVDLVEDNTIIICLDCGYEGAYKP